MIKPQSVKHLTFSLKKSWMAYLVLIIGLIITISITIQTKNTTKKLASLNFELICNDIKIRLETRLRAHAQLLRSGSAFFAASDTVTREEWRKFNENTRINRNLPGIQGVGYSVIIKDKQLIKHIQAIRNSGFPNYNIFPAGNRDIYTSIIYLEPFSGRNLRAFGYDMFTDSVRRKAMELSRDSNLAVLSDKVTLIQETSEDVQSGALMYVPVFRNGNPISNIEQRRSAIKGWVYSPYRMNDMMIGILGDWDLPGINRIHVEIFDGDKISLESLLYDSQPKERIFLNYKHIPNLIKTISFNEKNWTLLFTSNNQELLISNGKTLLVLIIGIVITLLLFALSITLLKTQSHADQILKLNKELEKHNHDKDRFISILAHDLRSPFNSLFGFAELLSANLRNYSIAEIEEKVNIINESAIKFNNLLNDTLIWALSQSGRFPFNPQKIHFSTLCYEVMGNLKFNANKKLIALNHRPANDLYVFADKNMLSTILQNLISNAIKFTKKGGHIDIIAEENDKEVTIMVQDNGVGMDDETINKLFDISQIFTTKGTDNETGTGLGLLLCKEFVNKNEGVIWVESSVGKGSSFKFTLPKGINIS